MLNYSDSYTFHVLKKERKKYRQMTSINDNLVSWTFNFNFAKLGFSISY